MKYGNEITSSPGSKNVNWFHLVISNKGGGETDTGDMDVWRERGCLTRGKER